MTCEDSLRLLLGAYVLGGLTDEEHRTFAAHLRSCRPCQIEAAELSGLPRLLDLVDDPFEPLEPVGSLLDPGPEGSRGLLTQVRQRRRRIRVRLVAAACVLGLALLALGGYVGMLVATPARPTVTAQLSATPMPGSAAKVDFALVSRAWGTQLELTATQLPTQGRLAVWIVDDAGLAVQVATWSATPAGRATLTGACATPTGQIRMVEVRMGSGESIARATT